MMLDARRSKEEEEREKIEQKESSDDEEQRCNQRLRLCQCLEWSSGGSGEVAAVIGGRIIKRGACIRMQLSLASGD
jgi:hypothetical protein